MVEFLLDQGANVNQTGKRGGTCLHDAAETGSVDIFKILLERGGDPWWSFQIQEITA